MTRTMYHFLATFLTLAATSSAAIVTISAGRFTGPFAETAEGNLVDGGLVRLGTLSGAPASGAIADIDAVFSEFGNQRTSATGGLGGTINNLAGTPFNTLPIFLWVFDTPTLEAAAEHGLFTLADPSSPSVGAPWLFPTHTGTGTDSVTISLSAVVTDGELFPIGAGTVGGNLRLAAIPEPSVAGLVSLVGFAVMLRRRHQQFSNHEKRSFIYRSNAQS